MEYIGDGVYAELDGCGGIWLETDRDGMPDRVWINETMLVKINELMGGN
tara:strand:- start:702 stop:848 length:147 start_codon:yes stop_codon:yes gene_type:complete